MNPFESLKTVVAILAGNPSTAIVDKGSVVISSSLAQKYYNLSANEVGEALNRILVINNTSALQVKGIIEK